MPKLSIILPVYNEIKTLEIILQRIERVDLSAFEKEIIIVDDYSTDGTREFLRTLENKYKIIYHDKNYGKGKGMRTGYDAATGDYIICHDADLEYNPENLKDILGKIQQPEVKVVYGSRFLGESLKKLKFFGEEKTLMPWHYIGNKVLSMLTTVLYGQKVTDMETGYKLMTREALNKLNLKSERFNIEPEITAQLMKNKFVISEVPIDYDPRDYAAGKKIGWKDGASAVWTLIKNRFL
ncbi:MAG: glycosyltransferase family 2 protein [Patescibacteria group bacterium]